VTTGGRLFHTREAATPNARNDHITTCYMVVILLGGSFLAAVYFLAKISFLFLA